MTVRGVGDRSACGSITDGTQAPRLGSQDRKPAVCHTRTPGHKPGSKQVPRGAQLCSLQPYEGGNTNRATPSDQLRPGSVCTRTGPSPRGHPGPNSRPSTVFGTDVFPCRDRGYFPADSRNQPEISQKKTSTEAGSFGTGNRILNTPAGKGETAHAAASSRTLNKRENARPARAREGCGLQARAAEDPGGPERPRPGTRRNTTIPREAEGTQSSRGSRKPPSRSVTRKSLADTSSRSWERARETEPFVVEPVKSPERRRTGGPSAGAASLELRRAGRVCPILPDRLSTAGARADTRETLAVPAPVRNCGQTLRVRDAPNREGVCRGECWEVRQPAAHRPAPLRLVTHCTCVKKF